ncbi:MAG: hypothetical protein Q8P25_05100 [Candidatus Curtissbacteria bacterium]|nr:hypothetical protein [Candidatus Curtissbacteria bacterium]
MGISEMMKSLNPKITPERKAKVKSIWLALFNKLDKLVKLNLIICPDSNSHYQESLLWQPYYKALKMMYEHLSNGISFYDEDTIKRFQIDKNFKDFAQIKDDKKLSVHDITTDDINAWLGRFRISVEMGSFDNALVDDIKKERGQIHQFLASVYKRWLLEKNKTFNDWYREETDAYLPTLMKDYSFRLILTTMFRDLENIGMSEAESSDRITDYFKSGRLITTPYVMISAGLFASLARKASLGKKTLPTKGMVTDVKTIASLAPYCDAMLIDNECRAMLTEEPLKTKLKLDTAFFSQSNINDFIKYLDGIEKAASKKHLKTIGEVYGDNWGEPFVEMYDYEE